MERPRTADEFAALPIGPEIGTREKTMPDDSKVWVPVIRSAMTFFVSHDDPMGYTDADGVFWSLGRYADGSWFRQRKG